MKKIIFSLLAIVSVAAVVGVGSYALWSDKEVAEDNYIAAGSLDLKVGEVGGPYFDDDDFPGVAVEITDAYPGQTGGSASVGVRNDGTVAGTLKLKLENVFDDEMSLIEPEIDEGDDETTGELCAEVTVDVSYNGTSVATDAKLDGPWLSGGITLDSDMMDEEEGAVTVSYEVQSSASNDIMTDKCEFDIVLDLEQN